MNSDRKLVDIQTPHGEPGFLGAGHTARAVLLNNFSQTDPFILLMDDWLDKQDDEPVGGPHPHAGFETVSFLLEGEIGDSEHKMKGGDFQIMTAGSGIIHTETIEKKAKMRLLQLWLTLPKKDRWAKPRLQDLTLEHVPKISENGLAIKVYSGSFGGITSPIQHYTPLIVADVEMQPGVTTIQHLPASYTTFLYVLEGGILVGNENKRLAKDQVGWLNRYDEEGESNLKITAAASGARFVLYAGQPQGDEIVSYGPFIGDNQEDIRRLYKEYRDGKMKHVLTLPEDQIITVA